MNKTFRVSFLLASKSKMKKDGKISILYRIHLGNQRLDMGVTVLSIDPKLWNSKTGVAIGKTKEAFDVNKQMNDIELDLRHIFRRMEFSEELSLERIKSVYLGEVEPDITFLEYFKKYNEMRAEEVGHGLSKASLQKYNVTKRRFTEYLMDKQKKADRFF